MFNQQTGLIFCILFASIWVQSLSVELTPKQITKIQNFETAINHLESATRGSRNRFKHLESWTFWNRTSNLFRLDCAEEYLERLSSEHLTVKSSEKDELAICAYEALDKECNKSHSGFQRVLRENYGLINELIVILNQGKFLHFLAYYHEEIDNWNSGKPGGLDAILTRYLKDHKDSGASSSST